jgi:hypothetical protein
MYVPSPQLETGARFTGPHRLHGGRTSLRSPVFPHTPVFRGFPIRVCPSLRTHPRTPRPPADSSTAGRCPIRVHSEPACAPARSAIALQIGHYRGTCAQPAATQIVKLPRIYSPGTKRTAAVPAHAGSSQQAGPAPAAPAAPLRSPPPRRTASQAPPRPGRRPAPPPGGGGVSAVAGRGPRRLPARPVSGRGPSRTSKSGRPGQTRQQAAVAGRLP